MKPKIQMEIRARDHDQLVAVATVDTKVKRPGGLLSLPAVCPNVLYLNAMLKCNAGDRREIVYGRMLALVTTAAVDPALPREVAALSAFLLYHLDAGFERIFVFLDMTACVEDVTSRLHPAAARASIDHVEFVARPTAEAAYPSCARFASLRLCLADEVQARQQLNCELAMRRCLARNVDAAPRALAWLVHLDLDEALYSPGPPLTTFFANLDASIDQFTFVNHEAVPTSTSSSGNFMVDVTHFKVNHLVAPFTPGARAAMRRFQARTAHGQYMLAYDNGKSAVRVGGDVVPASVHKWTTKRSSVCNFADPRHLDIGHTVSHAQSPWVLHYPNCGYDWFETKYARLGPFPDAWFQGALPIEPCFHTNARDVWLSCVKKGDDNAMREMYKTQVVLADSTEMAECVREGVCLSITKVADRVAALMGAKAAPRSETLTREDGRVDGKEPKQSDPPTVAGGYNSEKAWMLAAIAQQFLT
ncbi:Aste57867_25233 [Aphanomyces stellatus]|uniref:Aste57867_25233 protein n=1 Tax=Aphanomyces stellatus TaxID=120398 RepID=A0A485LTA1_9STRA|nr:hypothetical protein As57867_025155 [Aphanomyces stellatus]VFU01860.1 Aste57867_25233 [Aphanomyces stellatus]